MVLVITEKGKVTDVEIVCGPSNDIDKKAAAEARGWTFSPAHKDGRPVMVKVRVDSHVWRNENGAILFGERPQPSQH